MKTLLHKYLIAILLLTIIPRLSSAQIWEKIKNIPSPYSSNYWLDVFFLPSNPQLGWICGFNGRVIRTYDGGNTWQGVSINGADHLESIHFPSASVGYTSGVEGIFKTTDGGASWFNVTPTGSADIWGSYFVTDNYGVCLADGCVGNQHFWKTTNGGATWTEFLGSEPSSGLTDAIISGIDAVGYASSSGRIWQTTDGGSTWSIFSVTGSNIWQEEITLNGQSFLVPTAGSTCSGQGFTGGMRFSIDNGLTWKSFTTGVPMFGAFLLGPQEGWACGYNRTVYYTSDGGQHWVSRNCGVEQGHLDDIWFIDRNTGWLVGEGVYRFGRERREVSKNRLIFPDACVPFTKTDTLIFRNLTFTSVSGIVDIYNNGGGNFSTDINSFYVNVCDSQKIVVRFHPKTPGDKISNLKITLDNGEIYEVEIGGYGLTATAKPEDTLVVINPAPCGKSTQGFSQWLAENDKESIDAILRVSGKTEIQNVTSLPFDLLPTYKRIYFTATPIDTGWYEARFRVTLAPCPKDTFITVKAYGVSPIITAEDSNEINIECALFHIDTIPVRNTGNDSLKIYKSEIVNSNSGFSILGWTSGRAEPIVIIPGEADSIIVKFAPALPQGDSTILRLSNNDYTSARGNKDPYDIWLKGQYVSTNIICKDTLIDFGEICLGDTAKHILKIYNFGNLAALIQKPINIPNSYELLFPGGSNAASILPNDSILCNINFIPNTPGDYLDTLFFQAEPCGETFKVVLQGVCNYSELVAEPDSIIDIVQTGQIVKYLVKVKSLGNVDLSIGGFYFDGNSQPWSFNIQPMPPVPITTGGSADFILTFICYQDTTFTGSLCLKAYGKCPTEVCIPIKLISTQRRLEISRDTIDFGRHICIKSTCYATVKINNKGIIADTITKLDINPSNSSFEILGKPTLPYTILPGDSLKLIIKGDCEKEGLFEAELTVETNNPNGTALTVFLSSEYRSASTFPLTKYIDFGKVEQCDNKKEIKILLKNIGTLKDSLLISCLKDQAGFEISPPQYVIVPPLDSTEVIISLNPAEFAQLGNFSERFILTSKICQNSQSIDVIANIIRPRLTIEPEYINFGEVWVGDSAAQNITIKNLTNYDKTINDIKFIPDDIQYKHEFAAPYFIKSGETITVPLTFNAKKEGRADAKVVVYEESICKDTSEIPITANVPEEIYNAKISINKYLAHPRDTVIVTLNLEKELKRVKPMGIDYEIAFDPWLFYPFEIYVRDGIAKQPTSFNYQNGVITASIEEKYAVELFNRPGEIIFIKGMAFGSDPDSTDIKIRDFSLQVNKKVNIEKIDGALKVIGFCLPEGGAHLRMISSIAAIFQNPVTDGKLKLLLESELNQNAKIIVTDILGRNIISEEISISAGAGNFEYDISSIPSGTYFLTVLPAYSNIIKSRMVIVK